MKYQFFIGVLTSLASISNQKVVVCPLDDEGYGLSAGGYVQYETPNFPASLSSDIGIGKAACRGTFYRSDRIFGIWVVLLNGQIETFNIDDMNNGTLVERTVVDYLYSNNGWFSHYSNSSAVNLYFNIQNAVYDWIAFQSFVNAPGDYTGCPLSGGALIIKNSTEIYPITSDFDFTSINAVQIRPKITCDWTILVPENFDLKFHLISYTSNNDLGIFLKITPQDGSDVEITVPGIYTFKGSKFTITFIREDSHYPGLGFAGILTVVRSENQIDGNCTVATEGRITTFGNMDYTLGYQRFQRCTYSLPLNTSREVQMKVTKLIEDKGDTLKLISNASEVDLDDGEWVVDASFGEAVIQFSSDGSIVQAGFEVQLQANPECSCQPSYTITCDTSDFQVIFNPGFTGYCGGINCTSKITVASSCREDNILLSIVADLRQSSNDLLTVYLNSTEIKRFSSAKTQVADILVDPNTDITFNFYSDKNFYGIAKPGHVKISTFSFQYQGTKVCNLSADIPTLSLLIDSIHIGQPLIITAPEEFTLDLFLAPELGMYSDAFSRVRLYDFEGVDNFVRTLNELPTSSKPFIPRNTVSQSGSFTVLKLTSEPLFATVFFRLREIHTAYCPSFENVYSQEATPLQASASKDGFCMATILSTATIPFSPTNVITLLGLDDNDTVEYMLIANTDKKFPYLAFNSSTAVSWNAIYLFGTTFSFIIPPEKGLSFQYEYSYAGGPLFDENNLPAHGIISSANYADPETIFPLPNITFTVPNGCVMELKTKYFDFSLNAQCFISGGFGIIEVTATKQSVTLDSGEVTIAFTETNPGYRGVLFEFVVDKMESSSSTSEPSTRVSTPKHTTRIMATTTPSTPTSSKSSTTILPYSEFPSTSVVPITSRNSTFLHIFSTYSPTKSPLSSALPSTSTPLSSEARIYRVINAPYSLFIFLILKVFN